MNRWIQIVVSLFFLQSSCIYSSQIPDKAQQVVWIYEAVTEMNTWTYQDFLTRQQKIARYFTAQGWINYTKALKESKVPEIVQARKYSVQTVPLLPPEIKQITPKQWQAIMPILVVYENAAGKQKQTLSVTLDFEQVEGEGIRGFAINRFQSKTTAPPCDCKPQGLVQ